MAYRISYGQDMKMERLARKRPGKLILWILAAVLVVGFRLSPLYDAAKVWLLPGDSAVTAAALSDMTERIEAGENFVDAFTCFCMEIIENAEVPE